MENGGYSKTKIDVGGIYDYMRTPVLCMLGGLGSVAGLLLLPAALPLLLLMPAVLLASLPWLLHLPLFGRPMPLGVIFTPVIGFACLIAAFFVPVLVLMALPFMWMTWFFLLVTAPCLWFVSWLAWPLLMYAPLPSWLSVGWNGTLDFTILKKKIQEFKVKAKLL